MDQEQFEKYEKRALGWQIRCCKCDHTEHFGKYGIRIGAVSWKKFNISWCSQCRWLRFHAVEKKKKTLDDYNSIELQQC